MRSQWWLIRQIWRWFSRGGPSLWPRLDHFRVGKYRWLTTPTSQCWHVSTVKILQRIVQKFLLASFLMLALPLSSCHFATFLHYFLLVEVRTQASAVLYLFWLLNRLLRQTKLRYLVNGTLILSSTFNVHLISFWILSRILWLQPLQWMRTLLASGSSTSQLSSVVDFSIHLLHVVRMLFVSRRSSRHTFLCLSGE